MDVQAQERAWTERVQLERLQLGGRIGTPFEQRGQQPGCLVSLGKPAPKLNQKTGYFFVWKKQLSCAATNSCEDALLEIDNPIVLQGPSAMKKEELLFRHGPSRVTSTRMTSEGITKAISKSMLLHQVNI